MRFATAIGKNLHTLNLANQKISELYSGSGVHGMTKQPIALQSTRSSRAWFRRI